MKDLPGIFNDVIGPVMRGPSSSHTAASWRIARTAMYLLNDSLESALIEFDREGAWAPNYREQGTTIGMEGGLLGLEITDDRMKSVTSLAKEKGIEIEYRISSFTTTHPNTVRLTLTGRSKKKMQLMAVTKGGGSFEIRSVNGHKVHLSGDRYVLCFSTKRKTGIPERMKPDLHQQVIHQQTKGIDSMLHLFISAVPFSNETISGLQQLSDLEELAVINPVMPVVPVKDAALPFSDLPSLMKYLDNKDADLGQLGLQYEQGYSGLNETELKQKMKEIIRIIHQSIDNGLKGTHYDDRILQQQSHLVKKAENEGLIKDALVNRMISYVTAIMESKSAMEVIVAVPTAGSCGTVGGTLRALSEYIKADKDALIKAYFAAGLIGVFFALGPGFSAEEHGCQVECGAASGMAAAGIAQLLGGSARQALDAASMAIQNMIGLVCDPVADRVEVPCLGKNISAAMNAYSSAIMAIAGFDVVIPLDQVIRTVSEVSRTMPCTVKCTGKGGLATTLASKELKDKLEKL